VKEVSNLEKEIKYKQQMLNVTSTNLQHVETGYEYLKVEVKYNYVFWLMMGIAFRALVLVGLKYVKIVNIHKF